MPAQTSQQLHEFSDNSDNSTTAPVDQVAAPFDQEAWDQMMAARQAAWDRQRQLHSRYMELASNKATTVDQAEAQRAEMAEIAQHEADAIAEEQQLGARMKIYMDGQVEMCYAILSR